MKIIVQHLIDISVFISWKAEAIIVRFLRFISRKQAFLLLLFFFLLLLSGIMKLPLYTTLICLLNSLKPLQSPLKDFFFMVKTHGQHSLSSTRHAKNLRRKENRLEVNIEQKPAKQRLEINYVVL